jgi:protein-S-isoprenylcysteine O-methyltransferase Ste14
MPEANFYTDPFFWALLSAVGMAYATSIFSKHKLRRSRLLVGIALVLIFAGRVAMVLPLCEQPRFEFGEWRWIVGGAIIALSLPFGALPVILVKWWDPPREGMRLRTTGVYGLVRHPIYFFEVIWPVGLSVMFDSIYGLALTPVWWFMFLIHTLAEEADLERSLGEEYVEYKKKVRGRIFPGLPF